MDLRHGHGAHTTEADLPALDVLGGDPSGAFGPPDSADDIAGTTAAPIAQQASPVNGPPSSSPVDLQILPTGDTAAVMTETDNGRRMVLVPLEAIQSGQVKVPGLYSIPQPTYQGVHTSQLGMGFGSLPLQNSQPVMGTGFRTFEAPSTQPAMMNNVVMMRPDHTSTGFPLVTNQPSMGGLSAQGQRAVPTTQISLPSSSDIQPRNAITPGRMNGVQIKTEAPQSTMTGTSNANASLGMASPPFVAESRSRRTSDSTISTTESQTNQDSQNVDEDSDHKAKRNRGSYRCSKCGEPKRGHICPYRFKAKRRLDEPGPDLVDSECQAELDPLMTVRALKEWAARNGGEPNWIEAANGDLAVTIEDSGERAL